MMHKLHKRTAWLSLLALPALIGGCSSAPEAQAERTTTTSSALDPQQVFEPTTYTITLSGVTVVQDHEVNAGTSCDPNQNDEAYDPWVTTDTGYVYWAELGAQVNAETPATQACSLGPAGWEGNTLSNCIDGAYNNNQFFQGQPLSVPVTLTNDTDVVKVAVSIDNIEATKPAQVAGPNGTAWTKTLADGLKLAATLTPIAGPEAAPVGALFAIASGVLSLDGDLSTPSPVPSCMLTTCAGGLAGDAQPIPGTYENSLPPDTLWMQFSPQQLQAVTAAGSGMVDLYPQRHPAGHLANGTYDYGCLSSLHLHLTISRDWTSGQAASARSGDMAVVRNSSTIDAVNVDPSDPAHIVHYYGNGGSFNSEHETVANTLQAGGVTLSTSPVVISRTTGNVDVFWADKNGALNTVFQASPDYTWYTQTLVPSGGVPANAQLTAIARTPGNMDVFYAGSDGVIQDVAWTPETFNGLIQGGWQSPSRIISRFSNPCNPDIFGTDLLGGSALPGGSVAVVSRTPNDMSVFYIGRDGGICQEVYAGSNTWIGNEVYGPNSPVQQGGAVAPPGAHLTATARDPNHLDVFLVGNDRGLWTSTWHFGASWFTAEIPGTQAMAAEPGAPVGAVARQPGYIDVVFEGDRNSLVWSSFANDSWKTSTLGSAGDSVGNSAISIVAPTSYSLQVFYRNGFDQLDTMSWTDPTQCNSLSPVGCTVQNTQWSPIVALQPPPPTVTVCTWCGRIRL